VRWKKYEKYAEVVNNTELLDDQNLDASRDATSCAMM
jgi:hypothetical protein